MTADTDKLASVANSVLKSSPRSKQVKGTEKEEAADDVNHVHSHSRSGVLPPWGGAWGSGASAPIPDREQD